METDRPVGVPAAFDTIVFGGLAIGVLDFLDASLFFPSYFGIAFKSIWQGVASGVLGREASAAGGWNSAAFGILMHFVVATCIATVYFLFARKLKVLIAHPIISGMCYGIAAHFVMKYVVIPLSAIGSGPSNFNLAAFLNSIIGHALLVGLPVALIAAWSAKKGQNESHSVGQS